VTAPSTNMATTNLILDTLLPIDQKSEIYATPCKRRLTPSHVAWVNISVPVTAQCTDHKNSGCARSTPLVVKWRTTCNIGKAATCSTTSSAPSPLPPPPHSYICCKDGKVQNIANQLDTQIRHYIFLVYMHVCTEQMMLEMVQVRIATGVTRVV
jgi:hypothetical protein